MNNTNITMESGTCCRMSGKFESLLVLKESGHLGIDTAVSKGVLLGRNDGFEHRRC